MEMRVTVLVLVWCFLACVPVLGDTRCRTDFLGNTECRDDEGNVLRGRVDSLGNEEWRYDNGDVVRGRRDSLGNIEYDDDLDRGLIPGRVDRGDLWE
jgi:nuclear transport factor 2 (NTF2) superfamily protein